MTNTTSEKLRFNTGEVELAYKHWPGDSPPVVFLHGISSGLSVWEPRISLRGDQEAFAYDARGHGDSGRTESYTFVDFGRDTIRFLEAVVRQPAILVGHSLGGMNAVFAAAERPELVAGAFLIDPPLYSPEIGPRDDREPFAQRMAMAGKPVAELMATGRLEPQALQLNKLDPSTLGHVLDGRYGAGWNTDDLLRRIKCPVLLEHGERGIAGGLMPSALYEGEVDRAFRLISDCRVLEIKGSGHVPMVQKPQEFAAAVTEFIQSIANAASATKGA